MNETFYITALMSAVIKDHIEIVELLLKQEGIDINMKDILNQKY